MPTALQIKFNLLLTYEVLHVCSDYPSFSTNITWHWSSLWYRFLQVFKGTILSFALRILHVSSPWLLPFFSLSTADNSLCLVTHPILRLPQTNRVVSVNWEDKLILYPCLPGQSTNGRPIIPEKYSVRSTYFRLTVEHAKTLFCDIVKFLSFWGLVFLPSQSRITIWIHKDQNYGNNFLSEGWEMCAFTSNLTFSTSLPRTWRIPHFRLYPFWIPPWFLFFFQTNLMIPFLG